MNKERANQETASNPGRLCDTNKHTGPRCECTAPGEITWALRLSTVKESWYYLTFQAVTRARDTIWKAPGNYHLSAGEGEEKQKCQQNSIVLKLY